MAGNQASPPYDKATTIARKGLDSTSSELPLRSLVRHLKKDHKVIEMQGTSFTAGISMADIEKLLKENSMLRFENSELKGRASVRVLLNKLDDERSPEDQETEVQLLKKYGSAAGKERYNATIDPPPMK